jgi:hypothetical protein
MKFSKLILLISLVLFTATISHAILIEYSNDSMNIVNTVIDGKSNSFFSAYNSLDATVWKTESGIDIKISKPGFSVIALIDNNTATQESTAIWSGDTQLY